MNEAPISVSAYPVFAPAWAALFGEDRHGIFAGCLVENVGFTFRWIPPGRFLMGSNEGEEGRYKDEDPRHEVEITRGFWLGGTQVTQVQWEMVKGENPSRFTGKNRPVENVSWDEVEEYAKRLNEKLPGLNGRLPSEAEWEYACRAGTTGAFGEEECTEPTGKDPALEERGWYAENSDGETHEVGLKKANDWGLYDMHGNVNEWCADGLREYEERKQLDPMGAMDLALRVMRGGSYSNHAGFSRAAYRYGFLRNVRRGYAGFRLAADQPEAEEKQDERSEFARKGSGAPLRRSRISSRGLAI